MKYPQDTLKKLKELNKPFPQKIQKVIDSYNLSVPVFFVPYAVVLQFADGEDVVGHVWRELGGTGKTIAILIANDRFKEGYSKEKALLRTALHEIGHVKLHNKTDKIKKQLIKEFSGLPQTNIADMTTLAVENRVEDWVKQELLKDVNRPLLRQRTTLTK